MHKKILGIAIAAAVAAPLAAQAEIKMSGLIQGEGGIIEHSVLETDPGDSNRERYVDVDTTSTDDSGGALGYGGGPNKIRFDVTEDVGGGLQAFGRMDWLFNLTTTRNSNNWDNREKFVGIEMKNSAYFRMGRIQGAYKVLKGVIDPLDSTFAQMRGGGGETGGSGTSHRQFAHSSFVDNVMEIGFNRKAKKGFAVSLQTVVDRDGEYHESHLGSLKYSGGGFTVFGAVSNVDKDAAQGDDDIMNWKVGGSYKMGGLKLALMYEDAEFGIGRNENRLHIGGYEGQFVTGSAAYSMGKVTLAGWVSGYMDDTPADRITDGGTSDDAISFSVAAIYNFSKNTSVYAAYHQTDSDATKLHSTAGAGSADQDDEVFDWSAYGAGIRHKF